MTRSKWVQSLVETDAIDEYFAARSTVTNLFNYEDGNRITPFEDMREFFWCIEDNCLYYSIFWDTIRKIASGEAEGVPVEELGEYYEAPLFYEGDHKAIFEGQTYTLVRADIQDGNFLTYVLYNDRRVNVYK